MTAFTNHGAVGGPRSGEPGSSTTRGMCSMRDRALGWGQCMSIECKEGLSLTSPARDVHTWAEMTQGQDFLTDDHEGTTHALGIRDNRRSSRETELRSDFKGLPRLIKDPRSADSDGTRSGQRRDKRESGRLGHRRGRLHGGCCWEIGPPGWLKGRGGRADGGAWGSSEREHWKRNKVSRASCWRSSWGRRQTRRGDHLRSRGYHHRRGWRGYRQSRGRRWI